MAVIAVNHLNFESEVLHSERPVLVDFWASWCGPCRMMSPVLDDFAGENPGIGVAKVNVDENPELAMVYRISAIPSLLFFRDGKVAGQTVGFQSKAALKELVNS